MIFSEERRLFVRASTSDEDKDGRKQGSSDVTMIEWITDYYSDGLLTGKWNIARYRMMFNDFSRRSGYFNEKRDN